MALTNITGMLAIGNDEKCPYCETIITKEIDVLEHLKENHENKLIKVLPAVSSDFSTSLKSIFSTMSKIFLIY